LPAERAVEFPGLNTGYGEHSQFDRNASPRPVVCALTRVRVVDIVSGPPGDQIIKAHVSIFNRQSLPRWYPHPGWALRTHSARPATGEFGGDTGSPSWECFAREGRQPRRRRRTGASIPQDAVQRSSVSIRGDDPIVPRAAGPRAKSDAARVETCCETSPNRGHSCGGERLPTVSHEGRRVVKSYFGRVPGRSARSWGEFRQTGTRVVRR